MPDWMGPPENVVSGVVALELLLVRNERLAVWISRADAYPTGVLLHVELRGPEPARAGVEAGNGTWRFGVQFSDGQKATTFGLGAVGMGRYWIMNLATAAAAKPSDARPKGPQLRGRGGGGSRTLFSQSYWLWPLPPPGELLIACEWPNVGLGLTTTTISADELREAAARSRELWPAPDLPEWPGPDDNPTTGSTSP
jgi:hypothetical protein